MLRKVWVVTILLLIGLLFNGLFDIPADAQESRAIVFILDASGSMWGRVGGVAKIETAREVMSTLLGSLPEDSRIGLAAYGHRRKGDCQDIELITGPEFAERKKILESIERLTPKGKTPLAASLNQVGDYLEKIQEEAAIVLVSDGLETCGGDPCAVAEKLHQRKVKIVIHVIGFNVSGAAVDQLQCIARAGGGQYFQADSAQSLAEALTAVSDHVVKGTALPEPPPQPKVEVARAKSKRIKVAGPGTVELAPAPWVEMPPYYWLLVDAETGAEAARSTTESVRVKAGTYQVVWRQVEHGAGDVLLNEVVTVDAGKTVVLPLTTGLRLTLPEGLDPPYSWRLVDDAGKDVAAYGGEIKPQLLPSGNYNLIWRQTEHGHSDVNLGQVRIEPDRLNELVLNYGIVINLPDWLKPPYSYSLIDDNGRQITLNQVGIQLVPAGVYQLTWKQTEHGFSEIKWGNVRVPAKGFAEIDIDSGLTFVAGDFPPPYRIYVEDKTTGSWAEMAESWGPMPLPPGTYKVEMQEQQHGSSRITLIEELPIDRGQLIELEM